MKLQLVKKKHMNPDRFSVGSLDAVSSTLFCHHHVGKGLHEVNYKFN